MLLIGVAAVEGGYGRRNGMADLGSCRNADRDILQVPLIIASLFLE